MITGFWGTGPGKVLSWLWRALRPPRRLSRETRDWPRAPHRPTETDLMQMGLYRDPVEPSSRTPLLRDATLAAMFDPDTVLLFVDPADPVGTALVQVDKRGMRLPLVDSTDDLMDAWRRELLEAIKQYEREFPGAVTILPVEDTENDR